MIANVAAAIVHTPAARPSAPSVKFTTFITATIPTSVSALPQSSEVERVDERQRHVLDPDAGGNRDRRGRELARELDRRVQPVRAPVVDRADEGDGERAADDAARLAVPREEDERRDHHGGEDREAAEPGHGPIVQVAVARVVQHAQPSREPGDRRSGDEGDQRGDEERPEGIELVHLGGA